MTLMELNLNDSELSRFARMLALPVRVFIIRTIIENGFSVHREVLHTANFNAETINKHVSELRSLGLIKANGAKGNITYSIEQNWFKQMSVRFSVLFESINSLNPDSANINDIADKRALLSENEHEETLPNFGAFIRKHRTDLNISQEDLAKKIKIDRAQLSRIESGKSSLNADKLKKLSGVLYLDFDAVSKEYYGYRVAELIAESGYNEGILNRAKEKLGKLL